MSVHIFTCCCAHGRLHPCSRRLSARARGSSYARFQAVRHLGACAGCWCQAGGGERRMVEDRVGWLVGSGPGRRHTTIGAPGAGRRAELARSWHWSPHLAAAGGWAGEPLATRRQVASRCSADRGAMQCHPGLSTLCRIYTSSLEYDNTGYWRGAGSNQRGHTSAGFGGWTALRTGQPPPQLAGLDYSNYDLTLCI